MAEQVKIAKDLITDSNWINKTQAIMQENVMSLFEKFYDGAHNLVFRTASTTIIMLIVVYWLVRQIKTGYPTYDEIFKAGKYILILCGIFAVLSSFDAYKGFLNLLMIPESMITSVVSSIWQSNDFGEIITKSANKINNLKDMLWDYGIQNYLNEAAWNIFGFKINGMADYLMAGVATFFSMIPFWIFYIIFFILLIGITIVIFFSKFMAFLILSTLPLVLPFLIFTRFIPYLWSWYKLYLSYAIIAPLSFIALNLAINPILELEKYANANAVQDLFLKQFEYLLTGSITCITAIVLLKRIPSWINAVTGTQMESGSGGVASGVATGAIAGKTLMGGIASKAMGNSFFGGALNALGSATGTRAIGQTIGATGKAIGNTAQDIASGANKVKELVAFRGGHAVP